ncbi:MAG: hypothetical protein MZU95_04710 [Desulfomicrobium escambiense]|nr:hypothetical protein [Desulfomicrobium escambiense]
MVLRASLALLVCSLHQRTSIAAAASRADPRLRQPHHGRIRAGACS